MTSDAALPACWICAHPGDDVCDLCGRAVCLDHKAAWNFGSYRTCDIADTGSMETICERDRRRREELTQRRDR